jgi:hypothetical protein
MRTEARGASIQAPQCDRPARMKRLRVAATFLVALTPFLGCSNSSSPPVTVERVREHLSRALPALVFERTTATTAGRDMDSIDGHFEGSAKVLIIATEDMRGSMDLATARGEVAAILVNTTFSAENAADAAARVQEIAAPVADLYGADVASWTAYAIDLARRDANGIHVRSFGSDLKARVTWGKDAGQLTFSIETPAYPLYWNDPPNE